MSDKINEFQSVIDMLIEKIEGMEGELMGMKYVLIGAQGCLEAIAEEQSDE